MCLEARYSADGRFLVSAGLDEHGVRVWDLASGEAVAELQHPDMVFSARFDPSGVRVATSCHDGKVRVWDRRTGEQVLTPLDHDDEVTDAVFSPEGQLLVTGAGAGEVRVWDAGSGSPLGPPWPLLRPGEQTFPYTNRLEFAAGGKAVVAAVRSRTIALLDLSFLANSTGEELSAEERVLLAQINAGATVHPGGGVEHLNGEEWLKRWREFRRTRPGFHAFPESVDAPVGDSEQ
jgi:WD40 repeat protein